MIEQERRLPPFDPNVWSGRAMQEVLSSGVSGLASMYPVSSWSCFAPDHHGYQRACVLISGQASTGHSGHQCSHAPGRPILHLFLFLSQTSAGEYVASADRGHHGARNDRPDARHRHQARTCLILTGEYFDLAGEAIDALIQPTPVAFQLPD